MKIGLVIWFVFLLQIAVFGQTEFNESIFYAFYSKVIVLVVLAVVAISNYLQWLNENKKTDP